MVERRLSVRLRTSGELYSNRARALSTIICTVLHTPYRALQGSGLGPREHEMAPLA